MVSDLSMALLEATKLTGLLLTIPTTSASVELSFSAFKRVHTYLCSKQTQERVTKLPLHTFEKKILQDSENRIDKFYIHWEDFACMDLLE
jgi:hypothetical protein